MQQLGGGIAAGTPPDEEQVPLTAYAVPSPAAVWRYVEAAGAGALLTAIASVLFAPGWAAEHAKQVCRCQLGLASVLLPHASTRSDHCHSSLVDSAHVARSDPSTLGRNMHTVVAEALSDITWSVRGLNISRILIMLGHRQTGESGLGTPGRLPMSAFPCAAVGLWSPGGFRMAYVPGQQCPGPGHWVCPALSLAGMGGRLPVPREP